MDKRNRNRPFSKDEQDTLDFVENIVSSSECTGLEPTPPRTNEEASAYASLGNVPDGDEMEPIKGYQDKCSRGWGMK